MPKRIRASAAQGPRPAFSRVDRNRRGGQPSTHPSRRLLLFCLHYPPDCAGIFRPAYPHTHTRQRARNQPPNHLVRSHSFPIHPLLSLPPHPIPSSGDDGMAWQSPPQGTPSHEHHHHGNEKGRRTEETSTFLLLTTHLFLHPIRTQSIPPPLPPQPIHPPPNPHPNKQAQ